MIHRYLYFEIVVYGIIWVLIKLLRYFEIIIPYLNDYLTDIITIPALITFILICRKLLFSNINFKQPIAWPWLLIITIYVSVLCEFIGPTYCRIGTADVVDVCCYFLGALFFYMMQKKGCQRITSKTAF
ncbi:hypothetical protein Y10_17870 [Neptunitalea sp. Y10]|uniref:Magnesium citrate secondary transporter n=1 Tax=Neptunitalea lumnitzerae TaxID=2965509 RepID=A0ABQ5MJ40_9FLAO|nr:hypothetical protein Y10_17870 [Neptunitalea sp. Y10]